MCLLLALFVNRAKDARAAGVDGFHCNSLTCSQRGWDRSVPPVLPLDYLLLPLPSTTRPLSRRYSELVVLVQAGSQCILTSSRRDIPARAASGLERANRRPTDQRHSFAWVGAWKACSSTYREQLSRFSNTTNFRSDRTHWARASITSLHRPISSPTETYDSDYRHRRNITRPSTRCSDIQRNFDLSSPYIIAQHGIFTIGSDASAAGPVVEQSKRCIPRIPHIQSVELRL